MTYPTPVGRGRPVARRVLLALSTALATSTVLLATPVVAQSTADQPTPPRDYNLDQNGVDLVTGKFYMSMTDVSIGTGDAALSYGRTLRAGGYDDPYETGANAVATEYDITIGAFTDNFVGTGGYSTLGTGARLTLLPSTELTYTKRDGTRYIFSKSVASTRHRIFQYRATSIVYPNGRTLRIEYDLNTSPSYRVSRPSAVQSSDGYRLVFRYQTDGFSTANVDGIARWMTISSATATNSAVEYCGYSSCPSYAQWRTVTYAWSADGLQETRTDPAGRAVVTTIDAAGRITAMKPHGAAANRIALTYDSSGRVETLQTSSGTWRYAYSYSSVDYLYTTTVTSPTGLVRVVTIKNGKIRTDRTGTGGTTTYEYDSKRRLAKVIAPEGDSVVYGYDARDNVLSATTTAKGGAVSLGVTALFPATCDNALTCNKPTSVTDARGNTTDYAYDPTHGGVTRITRPKAEGQSHRAETRFTYSSLQASYYGSGGSVLQGSPIWKLSASSECSTGAATNDASTCVGTANETRTEIGYVAPGPRSNLLPTSIITRAGNSSVSASQGMTYNALGDVTTMDGPLPGSGDTTVYGHDATGAITEVRSPDPDGGGTRGSQATKIVRDGEGRVSEIQAGYYPTNTDGSQGSFVVAQTSKPGYDPNSGLKVTDALLAGSAVVQLTQYGYDADQRLTCTASRLNRVATADACVNAGGDAGSDVIEQLGYGTDGRVASVQKGGPEASYTYTPNGQVATVTDGEGNRTTYEYDGFDRLYRTRYPVPTKGANASSTTDFEQLDYDAGGNITSRRLRDGQVIGYGYDALGRTVSRDLPGDTNQSFGNNDALYTYDLLGRLTEAKDVAAGVSWSFGYDALGRVTTETLPFNGSFTSGYDAAGRRTRVTWPDGFFVTYDYDATGAMTAIRENGGFVLASFTYDELGRRKTLTRGNGTVTNYRYDPASRLASLGLDLAGSAQDQQLEFSYNGIGQIATRTASNGAYAWTGHGNTDRAYGVNGLNQATSAGPTTIGHDARGNVTSIGSATYGYDSRNLLSRYNGGTAYNTPLDQLFDVSGEQRRLMRSGDDVLSEIGYDGLLKHRYVHGPGIDEPLVWYVGAGTGDRRYLHADERGSVVAVTNGAGSATAINTYDEYGRPSAGNQGRFQYTGQKWIAELGLYDYKARMYAPQLGRFMQTDPIGYGDGMNLYGYVGGDPVNRTDPSGLSGCNFSGGPAGDVQVCGDPGGKGGLGLGIGIGISGSIGNPTAFHFIGLMDNPIPNPVYGEAPQNQNLELNNVRKIVGKAITKPAVRLGNRLSKWLESRLLGKAVSANTLKASQGIKDWLGGGYTSRTLSNGNKIFESADGLRRFRIDYVQSGPGTFKGEHAQFEVRSFTNRPYQPAPGIDAHIYFGGR